ncbi:hypothetical protein T440DRAFT_5497 [Plenodomus tracheiphilus IPT5]|uniref:Uncharacterized protein n=1 Tax=Plenodomus tracheiphilus IPT5 TaxID=1408161 RepID=A0A6A7BQL4_9PLEO|nr:hypothetical protein T440DRAFT_5497 [Plenodomus tracheiphilus IPT5]
MNAKDKTYQPHHTKNFRNELPRRQHAQKNSVPALAINPTQGLILQRNRRKTTKDGALVSAGSARADVVTHTVSFSVPDVAYPDISAYQSPLPTPRLQYNKDDLRNLHNPNVPPEHGTSSPWKLSQVRKTPLTDHRPFSTRPSRASQGIPTLQFLVDRDPGPVADSGGQDVLTERFVKLRLPREYQVRIVDTNSAGCAVVSGYGWMVRTNLHMPGTASTTGTCTMFERLWVVRRSHAISGNMCLPELIKVNSEQSKTLHVLVLRMTMTEQEVRRLARGRRCSVAIIGGVRGLR